MSRSVPSLPRRCHQSPASTYPHTSTTEPGKVRTLERSAEHVEVCRTVVLGFPSCSPSTAIPAKTQYPRLDPQP